MKHSLYLHVASLSFSIAGNHSEEDKRRKREELGGREERLEGGKDREWSLREELAANFAISETQNSEGKWESIGGKREYGDL